MYFPKSISASSDFSSTFLLNLCASSFLVNFPFVLSVMFLVNCHTFNTDYFGEIEGWISVLSHVNFVGCRVKCAGCRA